MNATGFTPTDTEQTAADQAREAADRLSSAGSNAANAARERARQAQDWARDQWSGLQDAVESQPQRATLWALGIGLVLGMVITGLMRGRD